jgi:hypothetical protein
LLSLFRRHNQRETASTVAAVDAAESTAPLAAENATEGTSEATTDVTTDVTSDMEGEVMEGSFVVERWCVPKVLPPHQCYNNANLGRRLPAAAQAANCRGARRRIADLPSATTMAGWALDHFDRWRSASARR